MLFLMSCYSLWIVIFYELLIVILLYEECCINNNFGKCIIYDFIKCGLCNFNKLFITFFSQYVSQWKLWPTSKLDITTYKWLHEVTLLSIESDENSIIWLFALHRDVSIQFLSQQTDIFFFQNIRSKIAMLITLGHKICNSLYFALVCFVFWQLSCQSWD